MLQKRNKVYDDVKITLLEPQRVFDRYFLDMINLSVETQADLKSQKEKIQVATQELSIPEQKVKKLLEDLDNPKGKRETWSYYLLKNKHLLHSDNLKEVPRRPSWAFKPFAGFNLKAGNLSFIFPSIYLSGIQVATDKIETGKSQDSWHLGVITQKKVRYHVIDFGLWVGSERLDVNQRYYLVFHAHVPIAFAVQAIDEMKAFYPKDFTFSGQTASTHWRAGIHKRLGSYLLDLRWFDGLKKLKQEKNFFLGAKIKVASKQNLQ